MSFQEFENKSTSKYNNETSRRVKVSTFFSRSIFNAPISKMNSVKGGIISEGTYRVYHIEMDETKWL